MNQSKIYLLFTPGSITNNPPLWYPVRGAQMGWGRMGGVEVSLALQADLCGIYILYNMGFFWKDFHIYLDMEKCFTLLGLRFLLF